MTAGILRMNVLPVPAEQETVTALGLAAGLPMMRTAEAYIAVV